MRRYSCIAIVVALLAGIGLPAASAAAAGPQSLADVIVVLHDTEDARAVARDMAQSYEARVGHVYEHVLTGFAAEVPESRLEGLRRDPRVDFVSSNGVVHAVGETVPTGVRRIDADDVWTTTTTATGAGVRVAILDTGIDLDHPDLAANVDAAAGKNCLAGGGSVDDDQGHGTHVAGTVAAVRGNGTDVVGVAPGAKVIPIKVLNSQGSGTWDEVICGIDWAVAPAGGAADVINLSLGGAGSYNGMTCGKATDALFVAICNGVGAGVTFAVAAGNDTKDASSFIPAAHPDVITVSAYSDSDGTTGTVCSGIVILRSCDETFASFSNFGSIVDVMAPGVDITSTIMGGGTGLKSGTSMAAPHVAGVVALLLQASPDLTPADVVDRLKDHGQCPDDLENTGTGVCQGQAWTNDGDAIAEPMVNAAWTVPASTSPPPATEPTAISLEAVGRKVKGKQEVDLTWSGATGVTVDIHEGGRVVMGGTANDGSETYLPNRKGGGTYTYEVCEAGTDTCSNPVTVTF